MTSLDLALVSRSDTLAGAAVPRPMSRDLPARRTCSPGELRVAMRAPRMGVEGVKSAPASIGATNPLRADERREPACWARDIAAAFREVDDSLLAIHRGTSMRPANALAKLQRIHISVAPAGATLNSDPLSASALR